MVKAIFGRVLAGVAICVMMGASLLGVMALHPAIIGDVDSDGIVNTTDARLLLQYAAGRVDFNAVDMAMADVDGSGKINTTDARLALQTAAGRTMAVNCREISFSEPMTISYYSTQNRIINDVETVQVFRERYPEVSELAAYDEAFFATQSLIQITNYISGMYNVCDPTVEKIYQSDGALRVYVSYTAGVHYWIAEDDPGDCVLLIPVEKQSEDTVVWVNYTYEIGVSQTQYPNSFFGVTGDNTPDFQPLKAQLYTVESADALAETFALWCTPDRQSAACKQFVDLHDEAFYQENATLILSGNYNSNYVFAGFRDNTDGTRTLLITQLREESNSIAPRASVLTVDVPKNLLAEKSISGFEIQPIE